jgi:hypothetical protein
MKQGFAFVTVYGGCVQDVAVFEQKEDANEALFDALKKYFLIDRPTLKPFYEAYSEDAPNGEITQFLEGLEQDNIPQVIKAYEWVKAEFWDEDDEFTVLPCEIHEATKKSQLI